MASFFGNRLELRPHLLSVSLSVSLLLTACSTVGTTPQTTPAAPVFTSTPGTAATQDSTYTYEIATTPAASGVTLALPTAPAGATLNGTTLTWTPTKPQSRVPDQFSVTATNAGGSAMQSWSVTPAGTISGTWVDTYWTPSGPVPMPFDFTKAPVPPAALVPQPDGSFLTVDGTGESDGTFSIPNIPGGYYWLRPALRGLYWTSSSTFDFGADLNFQPPKSSTTVSTTTLQLNFSGLDPLQAQDEVALELVSPLPSFVFPASSPVGATGVTEGALITSNVDFSQINTGFMLQYEPVTFGSRSALALGPEATVSNLVLSNGVANTVTETLIHSTQVSFDLNLKGSAWTPLFNNIGPGPVTLLGSDLSVITQPFGVSLLFDPPSSPIQLLSSNCFVYGPTSTTSFIVPSPGEPPVTADQDFGIVHYGDPFPSAWPRVFTFCQTASVDVPIPGSTSPVEFRLVVTQSTTIPTSQITPLVSQVQNPTLNGSNLFAANTVGATGVTLSWTAPAGATPTGYKIDTYVATVLPGGAAAYGSAGTFYTAKTSAILPPLQLGQTYVFLITEVLDGRANFETSPNRSALPTASASVVSAPITISAGL